MGVYSNKSLELLRTKIDLVEVVSSYVDLKSFGNSYKGLCPFHDEKTPSFMIQKGESHYHCFGCGAHGDAIAFLMGYMKMSFVEAVETLAERFHVHLDQVQWEKKEEGLSKAKLKEALQGAMDFYHFYLLYTDEGHQALKYLFARGIDLDFIRLFKVGLSPRQGSVFGKAMKALNFSVEALEKVGLIKTYDAKKKRAFFSSRIMFPILDHFGSVIGFSGRKIQDETFGPKYVNTPETTLFKKSQTLYGLSFSRRRIAKEKKAIIVEGQIDALRLIEEGFNLTVAGQGTAFTEDQVKRLLDLGVTEVHLALDGDEAGEQAASKIGHLFQKEGVEVKIAMLPGGSDPDTFLKEEGPEAFKTLLDKAQDYLSFLIKFLGKGVDLSSPSQKNHLVQTIAKRIQSWEHPLMVHESLRRLAQLTQVPENLIGVDKKPLERPHFIRRQGSISDTHIDPDRVLEIDLLRWLFLVGEKKPEIGKWIQLHIQPKHFYTPICRRLFSLYYESEKGTNMMERLSYLEGAEEKLVFSEIVQKKINIERTEDGVEEVVNEMLRRFFLKEREKIKVQIQSGNLSDEKVFELAKQFDQIRSVEVEFNR